MHACMYACMHSRLATGNPCALDCDGHLDSSLGNVPLFYALYFLPSVVSVNGLTIDDHDRSNAVSFFMQQLKSHERDLVRAHTQSFMLFRRRRHIIRYDVLHGSTHALAAQHNGHVVTHGWEHVHVHTYI